MHKLVVNKELDSAVLLSPKFTPSEPRPFYDVPAGYPSAAQDYMQDELDLNEYLLGPRKASIFYFRIIGNSMREAGILPGDIIIVDKAIEVRDGQIVVAFLNGGYTCKYYRKTNKGIWLVPGNSNYQPIQITEEMEASIFGVYKGLVRTGEIKHTKNFILPRIE